MSAGMCSQFALCLHSPALASGSGKEARKTRLPAASSLILKLMVLVFRFLCRGVCPSDQVSRSLSGRLDFHLPSQDFPVSGSLLSVSLFVALGDNVGDCGSVPGVSP